MRPENTIDPETFQQPALPEGEHCCRCDRLLDQTHGAAHWRGRWFCLRCFAR